MGKIECKGAKMEVMEGKAYRNIPIAIGLLFDF
jgi:hypothetical protein